MGKILHQNTTEVQESVSKGKVTSDIFKEAIANMTQAGGRFGGLMEQQSKTLEGQWSNIGDSIQQAFNEIGKKSEGVFSSGLSIISAMVENWQEVIKVISVATIAVGSYRASLMAAASIRKAEEAQQADDMMKGIDAEIKRLQDLENSNYKSLGKDKKQERVSKQQDLASIVGDTAVSDDFVKARLDAAEQEGVISAQMRSQLETKRELLQAQQQATAQSQIELDEEKRKTEELRQQKIESLKDDLKTTTEKISNLDDRDVELARQYTSALNDLQDAQDSFAEAQKLVEETAGGANLAFDAEGNAVNALEAKERLETATKQVNAAQTKISTIESERKTIAQTKENLSKQQATIQNNINTVSQASNTTAKKAGILATTTATIKNALYAAGTKYTTTVVNLFSSAVRSSGNALKSLWAAMAANPIGALITLGTTLYSVFSMFGDETEEISADTSHFGETASLTTNKVEALLNVMKNTDSSTDAHKKAKEELIGVYEQYGVKCDGEKENLETLKNKHDEFTASLQLENDERERANALMSIASKYEEARKSLDDKFADDLGGSWLDFGQHIKKEDISAVQMMFKQIVPDSTIEKIGSLKKSMDDATKGTLEYAKAAQDYDTALRSMLVPFEEWGKKMGYNSFQLASLKSSILRHVDSVNSLKDSYKRAEEAVNNVILKGVDWSNTQARNNWVNKRNKMSIDELTSSTEQLISVWSRTYGLNLLINVDDSKIPSWMKSMTDSQLKDLLNRRLRDTKTQGDYKKTHHGRNLILKTNGVFRNQQQSFNDAQLAKWELDKRNANKKGRTISNTTHTTPKKTGATDDPKARAYERKKAEEDYSKSISSYSERASDELSKRRTELIKNETEKEIAQINMSSDKEKKAIEDSIDKLVDAKKKKDQIVWVNSGKGRKANMWKQGKSDAEYRKEVLGTQMVDDKGNHLGKTIGQNSEDQIALIEKQRQLKLKEIQQAEIKDMLDFMKQYGSLEQQRYAILKEYTDKIDLAREKGDTFGAASAEMEMNDQLKKLNFSDFKDSINWDVVFQDMNRLSIPYLEDLRKKMKELLGSGTLEIDDMKTVSDQIYKIDDAISEQKDRWGLVNDAVREHRRLIDEAKDAQDRLAQARKGEFDAKADNMSQRRKIQGVFAESGVNIDTSNITSANKDKLMGSTKNLSVSQTEKLRKLFDDLAVSEVKVGKATKEVGKAQEEAKVKQDAAKKSLHDTIEEWAEGLRKIQEKLKDLPGLVDALGLGNTGFGKAVNNGMDALNSGTQAFSDFASGNYIGAAMNGIKTIGSLGKMFGIGGGNGAEVAKKTEELTESNDRLMYSIDKLKESIDKSSGYTAVSNYNAAYDAQKQVNTQTMDILKTQMGYHGAHHSNAYYWNLSAQDYAAINKTLAEQSKIRGGYTNSSINKVNSLEDIYKLTPEQMADIRTHNADVWKNMTDQGKYDKTEYWEQYTELAGKLEELTEQINENLTQTTFDSMKSDFINNLMDMSKSAKDFSNDFTTMLNQSMLNFALGDLMNKKLKPLYESWANKMKENGGRKLTPTELNNLKEEYDKIVQEGLAIRDNIADITGYKQSYEQSASSGSFESMSQDTGDELNGRFTAVQIATEGTYEETKLINTKLDAIVARNGGAECSLLTASVNTIMGNVGNIWLAVDEGRTILAQSLMYLQSIDERQERWHKPMLQAFNDIHELKDKMSRL